MIFEKIAADEEYAKRLQLAPSPSKNRAEFEPIDQVLLFQSSGHTASSSRQNIQPQMRTHSRHTWRSNERSTATAHARRRSPSFTHWQHYEHDTFNVPSDYLTRRNALLSQPTIEAIQRYFVSCVAFTPVIEISLLTTTKCFLDLMNICQRKELAKKVCQGSLSEK